MKSYARFISLLLALMVVAIVATGCPTTSSDDSGEENGSTNKGGTLRVAVSQQPDILNPFLANEQSTLDIIRSIIPTLFTIKPDFTYEPSLLAEEPTIEEDPFKVTYKLRDDIFWDDDEETPITSKDIKFTWQVVMDDTNEVVSTVGYDLIQSIETPDDQTAVLTFSQAYAPWKNLFSTDGVLPEHLLKDKNFKEEMIRSVDFSGGPFAFEEWIADESLTLVRNDNFWGDEASLDQIVFLFVEDPSTMREMLRNDEADLIIPPDDIDLLEQLKEIPSVNVDVGSGAMWEQIALNTSKPKLSDKLVRQAIAFLLDRGKITDEILKGNVKTLQSVVLPELEQYSEPTFEKYSRNPDRATALLEEAGWTLGEDGVMTKDGEALELVISTTANSPDRELVEQLMVENLKSGGIKATIENAAPPVFFGEMLLGGTYDIGIFSWSQAPDPSLTDILADDQLPPDGQNIYLYKSADATSAMKNSDAELDESRRARGLSEAQDTIAEDVPIIPLYQRLIIMASTNDLNGTEVNSTSAGNFWNTGEWSLEQ